MIVVDWGNEDETFIVWKFPAAWTQKEFQIALKTARQLLFSKRHKVHSIIDVRCIEIMPGDILLLAQTGLWGQPKNTGSIIILHDSDRWQQLYNTIAGFAPQLLRNVQLTRDVDDAYVRVYTALQQVS